MPDDNETPDCRTAAQLIDKVFPKEQVTTLHTLTGVPVRAITRWIKGETKLPTALEGKLRQQAELKTEFLSRFSGLLREYSDKGLLHEAIRQGLLSEISGEWFKNEESL